jgi:hypothetical protein
MNICQQKSNEKNGKIKRFIVNIKCQGMGLNTSIKDKNNNNKDNKSNNNDDEDNQNNYNNN